VQPTSPKISLERFCELFLLEIEEGDLTLVRTLNKNFKWFLEFIS
jgi:hypothetical protein